MTCIIGGPFVKICLRTGRDKKNSGGKNLRMMKTYTKYVYRIFKRFCYLIFTHLETFFMKKLIRTFLSDIHLSHSCNKKHTNPWISWTLSYRFLYANIFAILANLMFFTFPFKILPIFLDFHQVIF